MPHSHSPAALNFVNLPAQHASIEAELTPIVQDVIRRGAFILGPELEAFEKEFAAYCEAGHAVGVASGLDALRLTLVALGIGRGDEVILPANTFIATALSVSAVGARPVLVDCDPLTHNMDPKAAARAITARTKALMPVHLYGLPAEMDAFRDMAKRRKLALIEDACQAHGARYGGRRVGGLGHAGCFSFFPTKNLGACGDGGAVVTNDAALADRLRILRNVGQSQKYRHSVKGFNSRLDNLQAAILRVKLRHLDRWNADRARHADAYRTFLAPLKLPLPAPPSDRTHVYHLFVVLTPNRDAVVEAMKERGVLCGVHYPVPIHLQEAYRDLRKRPGAFPESERAAAEVLSLPMFPELTAADVHRVADALGSVLARLPAAPQAFPSAPPPRRSGRPAAVRASSAGRP